MNAVLRLKMTVLSVKRIADQAGQITAEEISLNAVYGPDGSENRQWAQWTPAGRLEFTVNNPSAFGKVLPCQSLFVDLIPVED